MRVIYILLVLCLFSLVYADDISSCTAINSSGSYVLTADLSGSPNPVPDISSNACILINSSDVRLNCDGYNITGDGSADT
jgi:hypothetical protein